MSDIHREALPEDSGRIIGTLGGFPPIRQFYLGGGTALALQIGHRISGDFDFFSPDDFSESALAERLSALGTFQLEQKAERTLVGILDGVKLSFLGYRYPLLKPLTEVSGVGMAAVADVVCMKLDAIASRGTKRDFIDVYFVAKEVFPLPAIMDLFRKKYVSVNYNLIHVRKSLTYFEDAEDEPMPRMLKLVDWNEVKRFFEREATRL
jgi:hypothetical protein